MVVVDTPARLEQPKLIVADVDVLQDNDVEVVKSSCLLLCCSIVASNDAVEPYGLWLLPRNPSDDVVKQDDVAVGLLLMLRFTCWPIILLLLLLSCWCCPSARRPRCRCRCSACA